MGRREVFVIGASAGGVDRRRKLDDLIGSLTPA
jgi:hypothetical protein